MEWVYCLTPVANDHSAIAPRVVNNSNAAVLAIGKFKGTTILQSVLLRVDTTEGGLSLESRTTASFSNPHMYHVTMRSFYLNVRNMYVGLDENGWVDTRYEDTSAEMLMNSVPDVVLHKVPDELGDVVVSTSTRWSKVLSFSKMT